ncbi:MAG: thioesterase family protein [Flavobacteriaceae bacterium]|nr:thioesterase family protein [Flavobacteriaceae bacterium]
MEIYKVHFTTRWSDFDANLHMRHTAYNDYAAEVRLRYFNEAGWTMQKLTKEGLGPVLLREETSFFKEIHIGKDISVTMELEASSEDFRKWKFKQIVYNENDEVSAEIMVFGGWIDLKKRKLVVPPKELIEFCNAITKSESYTLIPSKK